MSNYDSKAVYAALRRQVDAGEKEATKANAEWDQYRQGLLLAQNIVEQARLSDIKREVDAEADARKAEAEAEKPTDNTAARHEFLVRLGCKVEDPYSWGFLTSSAEVMVAVKREASSLGFVSVFENIISGNNNFDDRGKVVAEFELFYIKWQAPREKKKKKEG
jgi:hypothetical protein